MGYYTEFSLEIQPEKAADASFMKEIRNYLMEITDYTGWGYQSDGLILPEAKWYDCENDLVRLSKRYPDLKIEVHCQGEDGEQWMIYAFNGQIENCPGEVIFPPRTLW